MLLLLVLILRLIHFLIFLKVNWFPCDTTMNYHSLATNRLNARFQHKHLRFRHEESIASSPPIIGSGSLPRVRTRGGPILCKNVVFKVGYSWCCRHHIHDSRAWFQRRDSDIVLIEVIAPLPVNKEVVIVLNSTFQDLQEIQLGSTKFAYEVLHEEGMSRVHFGAWWVWGVSLHFVDRVHFLLSDGESLSKFICTIAHRWVWSLHYDYIDLLPLVAPFETGLNQILTKCLFIAYNIGIS